MLKAIKISIFLLITIPLFAQFNMPNTGFSSREIGLQLNNSNDMAGLLSRLQMNHSVSMSMGSSELGSQGMMSYTNSFYLPISNKIRFSGDVTLAQPSFSSGLYSQYPFQNQMQIYYDTNLEFDLGRNTKLSIGLSNKPYYYYSSYRPYLMGAPALWQGNE